MMKKLLTVIAILMLGTSAVLCGQSIPDVKVQDASGRKVSVRSLLDGKKPLVLTFWSTTCKPCMKELDALTDGFEEWNEEVPFLLYAVSTDDSRSLARAKALPSGKGWDAFPFLFDVNQDLMRALNISSIPHMVIYAPDGKLHYTHVGYMPGDEDKFFEELKALAR
ncbi:MAG: TlpA family protein disulfide reductase [Bacteroidales bacterium]|nr:TlpA family protein disulfide reductase [Bacteroidales bacterium]MBR5736694.1 TlpA family protein disulfide reductase [Bacteroidales bacterium]